MEIICLKIFSLRVPWLLLGSLFCEKISMQDFHVAILIRRFYKVIGL